MQFVALAYDQAQRPCDGRVDQRYTDQTGLSISKRFPLVLDTETKVSLSSERHATVLRRANGWPPGTTTS